MRGHLRNTHPTCGSEICISSAGFLKKIRKVLCIVAWRQERTSGRSSDDNKNALDGNIDRCRRCQNTSEHSLPDEYSYYRNITSIENDSFLSILTRVFVILYHDSVLFCVVKTDTKKSPKFQSKRILNIEQSLLLCC